MTDTPVELSNRAAAEPHSEAKTRLAGAVDEARDEILELSHRIHANPEPAFEEHRAAAWVAEAVGRHGYQVEHPAGRLPTAVRGRLAGGRGSDGPRIAILAASTPSKSPSSSMNCLPEPRSSAGVPRKTTSPLISGATLASAIAAPTPLAAMVLWPQP